MRTKVSLTPSTMDDNEFISSFTEAFVNIGCKVHDAKWRFRDLAKTDVAIIHWPNLIFNDRYRRAGLRHLLKMIVARKVFGTKFVWVVHNLIPHEVAKPSSLANHFTRNLDGLIHLSYTSRELVDATYPVADSASHLVTVHGEYAPQTKVASPRQIERTEPIRISYVGQIKPYKNIERLIAASKGMSESSILLSITGKVSNTGYAQEVETAAALAGVKVDARENFIDTAELEQIVDQSDCVVLPYGRILNSGSALFCLSRHRPIIVPNTGSLPELAENVGRDWVYLYDGEFTTSTLLDAEKWVRDTPRTGSPVLDRYSWRRVGEDLAGFLEQLQAR